eukprot:6212486-Pleurochrysis_carterae.AAC.2
MPPNVAASSRRPEPPVIESKISSYSARALTHAFAVSVAIARFGLSPRSSAVPSKTPRTLSTLVKSKTPPGKRASKVDENDR